MENLYVRFCDLDSFTKIVCLVASAYAYVFCGIVFTWICFCVGYINKEKAFYSFINSRELDRDRCVERTISFVLWLWPVFFVWLSVKLACVLVYKIITSFFGFPGTVYRKLSNLKMRRQLRALCDEEEADRVRVNEDFIKAGYLCGLCGMAGELVTYNGTYDSSKNQYVGLTSGKYHNACIKKYTETRRVEKI